MWARLTGNGRNTLVFTVAALLTAAAAVLYLASTDLSDDAFGATLRRSAHASFLLLLVVFTARPLVQLRPAPWTRQLLRNRRLVGVAFAGIHSAHFALIVAWDRFSPTFDFVVSENIAGGLVYLTIAAMLITSFDSPARLIGRKRWRVLHKAGLYFIFVAFLPTLVPESRAQLLGTNGLLSILAIAAVTIRILAFLRTRGAPERQPA